MQVIIGSYVFSVVGRGDGVIYLEGDSGITHVVTADYAAKLPQK